MAAQAHYYYGAKQDTPDYRDYKKVYQGHEIPSTPTVDLRHYVDHVYNQADLGSCTANALCAAYGLDLKKQAATLSGGYFYFDPSCLFLYYNTREYEGTTQHDAGASIRDTVKALNRTGVCKETDWPYVTKKYRTKPPASCYAAAQGNNLCKYEHLSQDINQLRACLKDNCPFVFGFKLYQSFHTGSNGHHGKMSLPSHTERSRRPLGLHAVMAVGYDDKKKHAIILNSWGRNWGDGGYFYMPYQFLTDSNMCFDFWKISFACERGKPRPPGTSHKAALGGSHVLSAGACSCGGACGTCGRAKRYYGAIEDDFKDEDYEEHYDTVPYWKTQCDLSEYVSEVYDQGPLNSCTANALCALYSMLKSIEDDDSSDCDEDDDDNDYNDDYNDEEDDYDEDNDYYDDYDDDDDDNDDDDDDGDDEDDDDDLSPSRLFLYYNSRLSSENKYVDSGSTIRDAVIAFNMHGVCDEEDWPYKAEKFDTKPFRRCYRESFTHKLLYQRLTQDLDQFRACINDSCPFLFGFKVYKSFESDLPRGMLYMPSRQELHQGPVGQLVVVAVGYNDHWRRFKCLNSWGTGWGDGGFFYMPYDYIKNKDLCFDFWKITFAD